MAELLNGLKRTDMCGNLRKNDENREVVVMGFVAKTRDLGNLVFIDLRDRTGIVQLAFDAGVDAALTDKARSVRAEYVVSAKGTVRLRTGKNINENMPTGDVEIDVKDLRILSEAFRHFRKSVRRRKSCFEIQISGTQKVVSSKQPYHARQNHKGGARLPCKKRIFGNRNAVPRKIHARRRKGLSCPQPH